VAAHDLELASALCQRTIRLDGGKIVADDNVEKIVNDISLLGAHGLAPA
jgi:cobalt/nickel transport system ATP-binding protein